MSPQILQAMNINDKDDIYSFGITMWQLYSNEYPYNSIYSNDIVAYRVVKFQMRPNNIGIFSCKQQNKIYSSSYINVNIEFFG